MGRMADNSKLEDKFWTEVTSLFIWSPYKAKAETPVLWLPHVKSWLIGKNSDAGRGWGQEEKGTTKDEMAGWHHRLDGHEFEWTPGVGDGQEGLACCDSWGREEPGTTEGLNWTDKAEPGKGLKERGCRNCFSPWMSSVLQKLSLCSLFCMLWQHNKCLSRFLQGADLASPVP